MAGKKKDEQAAKPESRKPGPIVNSSTIGGINLVTFRGEIIISCDSASLYTFRKDGALPSMEWRAIAKTTARPTVKPLLIL